MIISSEALWTPCDPGNIVTLNEMLGKLENDSFYTENLTSCLISYVDRVIPYSKAVYRAEVAEKNEKRTLGGSCYARSGALGSLLVANQQRAFIVLETTVSGATHAGNLVDNKGSALYADALTGTSESFIHTVKGTQLEFTYDHEEFIDEVGKEDTDGSDFARYFWVENGKIRSCDAETSIAQADVPARGISDLHIVTTVAVGIEMLNAIGDLTRYRSEQYVAKHGYDKYESEYPALISSIPPIITLPAPTASLAHA